MTIATAIAALAPNLWLKLDETTGTTAANSGSLSTVGTYSGSIQQGLPGPENDTRYLRVYTTGQVVTGGMDVTVLAPMSLGAWVSFDASGTVNTQYPWLGIGDVSNRLSRGPILFENHTSLGSPRVTARWNTASLTSAAGFATPALHWHYVVATFDVGTNGVKMYVDGTLVSSVTNTGSTAALNTDPLLIRCDEPMAIAHVCFWAGRILSQVEIQSVSNQLAPWPPGPPINTMPGDGGGGTGGGLTEAQAAQLTDIDTKTDDIPGLVAASTFISDTVNHIKGITDATWDKVQQIDANLIAGVDALGGLLQQVLSGITTTVTDAVGTVTGTIGQLLGQHAKDVIGTNNPYDGPVCTNIDYDASGQYLWGMELEITTRPVRFWPMTPDNDWTVADMAVVRIISAGEQIFRSGIHTSKWALSPLPGVVIIPFPGGGVPRTPPGYHIHVEWAEGVCGNFGVHYLPE